MSAQLEFVKQQIQRRFAVEPGLTNDEIAHAERTYGFTFPPDLHALLSFCLPVGTRFPNWRRPSAAIRDQLAWPFEGIAFDIRHSNYWRPQWGERPAAIDDAILIAKQHVENWPRLILIFAHVYLPADPCLAGNPVFSVYQTDIIYCGADIFDFLGWLSYDGDRDELEEPPVYCSDYRSIRCWSDLVRENTASIAWTPPE
jgi:hypothetical protein